jgi:hypothetical protein
MSYRYEVNVQGKWYDNQAFFETEGEASKAGYNKMFNWTQCDDYRVVPSDQPANYRWNDTDGMVAISN